MVKQKLFIGSNYATGIYGKKLLVVGHEKHATPSELEEFKKNPTLDYTYDNDNIEMLNDLCTGKCMTTWEAGDRKAWLQFGKMLSGNLGFELGTENSCNLLNSLAFCNYLQVPDFNLEARQGKDKEELYVFSESIFKEYLDEITPDKIIVWGNCAYPHIAKLGKIIDDHHCMITMPSGHTIDVLRINHPSRVGAGGYEQSLLQIKEFLKR